VLFDLARQLKTHGRNGHVIGSCGYRWRILRLIRLGEMSKGAVVQVAPNQHLVSLKRPPLLAGFGFSGVLSAFEPARRDSVRLWSLPFKQLPEYRARWPSGACSESAV
jgi:hypothetical protein